MVWDFDQGASALQGLSLAIGVAVSRALNQLKVEGVQLKWPNDIYINNKKLGGILLEMVGDPAGQCTVIIGIGINHCMPKQSGENIDQAWTDLSSATHQPVSRNALVACIINHCFDVLDDYQQYFRLEFDALGTENATSLKTCSLQPADALSSKQQGGEPRRDRRNHIIV